MVVIIIKWIIACKVHRIVLETGFTCSIFLIVIIIIGTIIIGIVGFQNIIILFQLGVLRSENVLCNSEEYYFLKLDFCRCVCLVCLCVCVRGERNPWSPTYHSLFISSLSIVPGVIQLFHNIHESSKSTDKQIIHCQFPSLFADIEPINMLLRVSFPSKLFQSTPFSLSLSWANILD